MRREDAGAMLSAPQGGLLAAQQRRFRLLTSYTTTFPEVPG
jgi:hypothetical protein